MRVCYILSTPRMDGDIASIVSGCHACQLVSPKQPPEPMTPTPIPHGPLRELRINLMDIEC